MSTLWIAPDAHDEPTIWSGDEHNPNPEAIIATLSPALRQFVVNNLPTPGTVIDAPRYGEVYCDGDNTCGCPPAGGEDA